MKQQSFCFQNAVRLWRIRLTAVFVLLTALCAVLILLFGTPALVVPLFLIPGYGFLLLYYIPAYFRRFSWTVQDGFLTTASGIWWQKARSIPLNAVQFMVIHRTPLSSSLEIFSLSLHLTGGSVLLPALSGEDLNRLKEALS